MNRKGSSLFPGKIAALVFLTPALLWFGILVLPWRPWKTREVLDACQHPPEEDLTEVTALIPARNEAGVLPFLFAGLKSQGNGLSIVLVDDQSTDGTGDMAHRLGEDRV